MCTAPPMLRDVAALHRSERETGGPRCYRLGARDRPAEILFGGKEQLS